MIVALPLPRPHFIGSFVRSFVRLVVRSFGRSFVWSFVSFVRSFVRSFAFCSFVRLFVCIVRLVRSVGRSFTSPPHSLQSEISTQCTKAGLLVVVWCVRGRGKVAGHIYPGSVSQTTVTVPTGALLCTYLAGQPTTRPISGRSCLAVLPSLSRCYSGWGRGRSVKIGQ